MQCPVKPFSSNEPDENTVKGQKIGSERALNRADSLDTFFETKLTRQVTIVKNPEKFQKDLEQSKPHNLGQSFIKAQELVSTMESAREFMSLYTELWTDDRERPNGIVALEDNIEELSPLKLIVPNRKLQKTSSKSGRVAQPPS